MLHRFSVLALVALVSACSDDGSADPETNPSSGSSSSTGSPADDGSTSEAAGSSSSGDASASSTGEPDPVDSATDTDSDTDTDGGSDSDCTALGGVLIDSFTLSFETQQVQGEDVDVENIAPLCLFSDGEGWAIRGQWGQQVGSDWESLLWIRVPGAGTYDLATDFGQPGSGQQNDAQLSYSRSVGAETLGFDTANQAAGGTLQVDAWPIDATNPISLSGDGFIAGEDGWRFVFTLSANED